ncbi:MAG: DUF2178 domain-containing protein [Candidatus Altiarchaeales archaeon]|nr:DUF2178 domain-containing protein [Candidatus Altiarchaeales archaeon]
MKKKTYTIYKAIIVAAMGGTMGWSFATGYKYLPFIALIVGIGFMYILAMHKPKQLVVDERDRKIAGKASAAAYQVYSITAAILGLGLKTLTKNQMMNTAGDILLYSACVLILIYLSFYSYYNRRGE